VILVDTSVLVDLLKGARTPASARLRSLDEQDVPYAVPAICAHEVLQGARDEREWQLFKHMFTNQELVFVPPTWETHETAARIFYDCRRKGITLRSTTDCLIAQLALDRKDVLLHDDDDFEHIARVRPLQLLRS
jgi:hypothetical protein